MSLTVHSLALSRRHRSSTLVASGVKINLGLLKIHLRVTPDTTKGPTTTNLLSTWRGTSPLSRSLFPGVSRDLQGQPAPTVHGLRVPSHQWLPIAQEPNAWSSFAINHHCTMVTPLCSAAPPVTALVESPAGRLHSRCTGPTHSRAARCPKSDCWFSRSRPVPLAVVPAPTITGTSPLVPQMDKTARGAPAALRPPGSPPHCSLLLEPPRSPSRHRTRLPAPGVSTGPVVSLREGGGVSSPSGIHTVWGVRHAPSDPLLHPHWGRNAMAEARAAEQGRNTSAHAAMLATPPAKYLLEVQLWRFVLCSPSCNGRATGVCKGLSSNADVYTRGHM
ncbi:hypothetical protein NDU88_004708 [Pleurodeles waltl]|uniref:Uncharacterized protein n=1 Tax=Pleurodeles waltl TaxID=8319 RepID=A0AAV7PDV6_PLEWA|nr:hypothetical protein NDU88_004708 [Pleurodeles waltl]